MRRGKQNLLHYVKLARIKTTSLILTITEWFRVKIILIERSFHERYHSRRRFRHTSLANH